MKTVFKEVPANKKSISMRKLVFGVGTNDATYIVKPLINGKQITCPFYAKWSGMIERCQSEILHKKQSTYTECSTCDEWLLFSNFKKWMKTQDWKGKELDKDILVQGNKVYSPETCMFVERSINVLFTNSAAVRGEFPQGVSYHKNNMKFMAKCSSGGKRVHIGYYDNPEDAYTAYRNFKYKLIADIAANQTEPLKSALLNYKISEY